MATGSLNSGVSRGPRSQFTRLGTLLVGIFLSGICQAGYIDFEGLPEGASLEAYDTGDNLVSISTSTGWGLVAASGGKIGGFAPYDMTAGDWFETRFLTDESNIQPGLDGDGSYFMDFAHAITSIFFQAADYRADGGGKVGDIVTLAAYADADRNTLLGTHNYVIDGTEVDGHVLDFTLSGVGAIRSVTFTTSGRDIGTGIDNIRFETAPIETTPVTVPEPGTIGLLSLGIGMLLLNRRRARSQTTL